MGLQLSIITFPVPRALKALHTPPPSPLADVYNIIPIHDLLTDHPSLRYPEVHAASASLRAVGNLPKPPYMSWNGNYDLMDWLGLLFGFQRDNVRNQREHVVLHLANSQMRLEPPPSIPDTLDAAVLRRFRKKLLENYTSWCSFLGRKSQVTIGKRSKNNNNNSLPDLRRELLYVALYLLIWGESGNLRFMPECLCYIYHHMAMELNDFIDQRIDPSTGSPFLPSIYGECTYLKSIVMPIYQTIKTEVESSLNGTKPHFGGITTISMSFSGVGVMGFVNFVAWEDTEYPSQALERRDVQVELLTCFITWAGLRVLQSVLDAGTQYSLVTREPWLLGLRMVLKCTVAITWTILFVVFYARIWSAKNGGSWSPEANNRIVTLFEAAFLYIIPELLPCNSI
ncbi:hypothetical protein K2173_001551 [Erythroxylum novogranatense]|uniref:1,3-beta-glucan synthase component FKS1-like domain-containing protein n=1 Tax=Erythroxylum novogranatense TaxID=1862640 RepID=A0AAV8T594_9ROSI|nr:hypothetical protein K2173_001551 [Erythroxylum novogranatense]